MFVSAPLAWLWIVAIVVGEWGHSAALGSLLVAGLSMWRGGRIGFAAAAISAVAAVTYIVPAATAAVIARSLPARCSVAFGDRTAEAGRPAPFRWVDLFRGVRVSPVDVTEHAYATYEAKQLKLDLYQSRQRRGAQPLIMMIHGGSWNGGNKNQLPAINRYLASTGYTVASLDYRHAPKYRFPAAVVDVFRAIDFLRANAATLQIDATRIVLIGRSAGGQLALSAAYAAREPAIRGAIAFYAPTDLVVGYEKPSRPGVLDSHQVLEDYLGGTPAQKPAKYAAASPVSAVSSTTPPTLLIQGGLDPIVWPIHSELLASRLKVAARPHLYLALPWATHGCDTNLSGPSSQLSLYVIDRFLANVAAPADK